MTAEERAKVNTEICRIVKLPEALSDTDTGRLLSGLTDTGGKMLRPQLMYAAASFGTKDPNDPEVSKQLALCGALIELTHLSSLIHDDIIDDAPVRRGKPSVQAHYGKDAAVFAGDFLIARIHHAAASAGLNDVSVALSEAVEQMCAGEIGQALCRYRTDTTLAEYDRNLRGKTAALFQAALKIGAERTGCEPAVQETLLKFGEEAGILFQLKDDLLDLTACGADCGKETMRDFREGIYTLPVLLSLQTAAGPSVLLPILKKNQEQKLTDEEAAKLPELLRSLGGIPDTQTEIRNHEACCRMLLSELPERSGKADLLRLLEKLVAL